MPRADYSESGPQRREAGAWRERALALALVACTLAAYAPTFDADFVWDDDANITANPNMGSLAGLRRIWVEPRASQQYYPLTHTSFWIEHALWSRYAPAYHLTNVLLQAANATLLALLLRRLAVPGALLAAFAFALHPVHVESVAWITERKNLLCGLLALASTLAYCRWSFDTERPHRAAYGLSLALFAAALLAKTAIAPLPFVLLLVAWWKRPAALGRNALALLPFLALAAAAGSLTLWLETRHAGAGVEWELTLPGRLIVAGRAAWFYAAKLAWPSGLVFIYPRWSIEPSHPVAYLWPLAALALPAGLWLARARIGRGAFVAVAAYALLLAPALGVFDVYFFVYSWVQDHFQYFASIPALALLAALLAGTATRRLPSTAQVALALCLLALLGGLTWRRAGVFENSETLYRDTLAKNPAAWMAHNNLGNWLVSRGRLEEGLGHLAESVRLHADSAEGQQSLGAVLLKLDRPAEAVAPLERALAIWPAFTDARHGLCHALAELGRLDDARRECERLVQDAPTDALAHHKLGRVLLRTRQLEQARAEFAEAVRLAPARPELRADLALALALTGRAAEAETELREALRLDPGYVLARHRLGLVLLETGRAAEAVPLFEWVLAVDPGFAGAREALARARSAGG